MSKVGEKPITVPQEVEVKIEENTVLVKGPKGSLTIELPEKISVSYDAEKRLISVKRSSEYRKVKALHGLFRTLIANAVKGVVDLWEKKLEVVGTGYNVRLEGNKLVFKVGYSHLVEFPKPEDIEFQVDKNRIVIVRGVDKQRVGEVASKIRNIKKPDAYKGKGIRYVGEVVRLKPGKKAKTG